MNRNSRLRRCGKRYPDAASAQKAAERKAARSSRKGKWSHARCRYGCRNTWHIQFAPAAGETGFSKAVRALIRKRAGNGDAAKACCEACGVFLGKTGGQMQHIYARQSGGATDPLYNSAANGALLCGTRYTGCHGLCEDRDPHMEEAGFWRKRHGLEKPGDYPVMLHGEFGGVTVRLTADGGYAPGELTGPVT